MTAIVLERIIAATPERVFIALTTPDERAHWWADEAHDASETNDLADIHFGQGANSLWFAVTRLDPGKKVDWILRQGPPHWIGTSVTWQLTPMQNETQVVFTHDGFAQEDAAFDRTRENWDYFLNSLKAYLETGTGTPGVPRSVN